MPAIDFTGDELAAVAAALRRVIEDDKYPLSPRLDPLRAALGKLDAALREPSALPKAPTVAKADNGARSAKAKAPDISPGFKLGRLPPDR